MDLSRRWFLRTTSALGMTGIAGCPNNQTPPDDDRMDEPDSGSTVPRLSIISEDGEQLEFLGLSKERELYDEDYTEETPFMLGKGVLVRQGDDVAGPSSTRLTFGRDVFLGVRKNNTLKTGKPGGTAELIKNPARAAFIAMENDYPDGRLVFESKGGGGIEFKTQDDPDDSTSKAQRLFIRDSKEEQTEMHTRDLRELHLAADTILFSQDWQAGASTPSETMRIDSSGVDYADNRGKQSLAIYESPPDNPRPGDMVIADGSNWDPDDDGAAEKVIYNGEEWIEDTDLKRPLS